MTGRPIPWLCLLIVFPLQAQNLDSIAYYDARAQLIAKGFAATDAVITAADELAAEALFSEAQTLLNELLGKTGTTADTLHLKRIAPAPVQEIPPHATSWKISSAADYTRLEEITNILSKEEEEALGPIRDAPFTISSKAALTWKPASAHLHSVEPAISVSNQKTAIHCMARGALGSIAEIEAEVKAEKRLANTGSTIMGGNEKTRFIGGRFDSLDMGGGHITITPGNPGNTETFQWKTPATVEAMRYLHGRSGYYSFNYFRAAPEVALVSNDRRKSGSLRLLSEYKNYISGASGTISRADSLDIFRVGPELSGDLWWQRLSANATSGYLYERYMYRGIPCAIHTFSAEAQVRAKLIAGLEALVQTRYELRKEYDTSAFITSWDTITYSSKGREEKTFHDTTVTTLQVHGYETEITPTLRWSIVQSVTLELRCPISLRSFSVIDSLKRRPLENPLFIIESRRAFEPEFGLDYSGSMANIRATLAYVAESLPTREYYTQLSSKGWKTRLDFSAKISRTLSCYASVDYQFRGYKPYKKDSPTSTNVSAAAGFSVRL